jgi:hypothetical protein
MHVVLSVVAIIVVLFSTYMGFVGTRVRRSRRTQGR